ncbi:MAG: gamma-glutamyltransferase family protein [Acidobacteria bacterium]|nr:gamma-glutamyltransferase family protein [Acidobacteriota bacterium]
MRRVNGGAIASLLCVLLLLAMPTSVMGQAPPAAAAPSSPAGQTYTSISGQQLPRAMGRSIPAIWGMNGIVAAPSPIAPSVALNVLMQGGNAVDAAVTAAAMVTLTDLASNSIGGHGTMVMYWAKTKEVKILDWGGFLPHAFTIDQWGTPAAMPQRSVLNTIMPGTLAGWAEALRAYGTIPLAKALAPSIKYAEEGLPTTPSLARRIAGDIETIKTMPELARMLLIDGRAPAPGELLKLPDLARTYRLIAEQGPDVFYKGAIAEKIVKYMNDNGSRFTREEFATYKPIWRDFVTTTYRDRYQIYTVKNQNFSPVICTMFNVWEHFDLPKMGILSAETLHLIIEATKMGLADRTAYYGDPDFVKVPYDILTGKAYGKRLADKIRMNKALPVEPGDITGLKEDGHTLSLSVVDKDQNAVLLTQTLGGGWGSYHVVPGTGIILNNEGTFFDLAPGNTNYPMAGKRVENQMAGALVLRDGKLFAGMGAPGGTSIPVNIAQVLERMIDFDAGAQEAIEVPRVNPSLTGRTTPEQGIPWETLEKLWKIGHYFNAPNAGGRMAGFRIWDSGVIEAGAEPGGNYTSAAY